MPEISRFYGIVIKVFYKPREHDPAHIHAIYGEYVGIFNIATHEMTDGDLPAKAQQLVVEWLERHDEELLEMWRSQKFRKIKPL